MILYTSEGANAGAKTLIRDSSNTTTYDSRLFEDF